MCEISVNNIKRNWMKWRKKTHSHDRSDTKQYITVYIVRINQLEFLRYVFKLLSLCCCLWFFQLQRLDAHIRVSSKKSTRLLSFSLFASSRCAS